ncbi:MAG: hypothetical protein EHM40_21280 [Chloroflexi bacterium]|nr:MAG: hypothetical protein EHM40_21280 [Chloroflexota bacterium]
MLTTQNSGKYLTRSYERDKNAGELDSSGLTATEISFLEIQDGEGQIKHDLEQMRRRADGVLHDGGSCGFD